MISKKLMNLNSILTFKQTSIKKLNSRLNFHINQRQLKALRYLVLSIPISNLKRSLIILERKKRVKRLTWQTCFMTLKNLSIKIRFMKQGQELSIMVISISKVQRPHHKEALWEVKSTSITLMISAS